jgi:hypothetical protein
MALRRKLPKARRRGFSFVTWYLSADRRLSLAQARYSSANASRVGLRLTDWILNFPWAISARRMDSASRARRLVRPALSR